MKTSENYGGVDRFRIIAALLIVGIHTYPLSSVSEELNFLLVHVFARIAVPFFLMVTGYFLLPQYLSGEKGNIKPLIKFIKKTGLLYAAATVVYLPVSIYAGHYSDGNIAVIFIRNLIFDGTFYHLWYLPASITGVLVIYFLGRRFSIRTIAVISSFLYILGLLGDSYYGVTLNLPFLNTAYHAVFQIFSYTRNGIFYAPIFLVIGAVTALMERRSNAKASVIGFIVSMLFMLTEGVFLRYFNLQRHDSIYIFLVPCVFFLFCFLLTRKGKAYPFLRDFSMWIFITHPLFIIAVRGAARLAGLTALFIENSLIHYFAVCLLSCIFSIFIAVLQHKTKPGTHTKGRAWIELDMENLRRNIKTLRNLLPDNCQLMPAVKANAYGHGAVEISRELNACGIRAFCVASVLEGVELRKHGIKGEILILGYTCPTQFNLLKKYRLTQSVIDYSYAKILNDNGGKFNVHIEIDTGMCRSGERSENIDNILEMFEQKNLIINGLYTHLCVSDSDKTEEKDFTQTQIDNFYSVLSKIEEHGFNIPKIHIQSSYGIFNYPDLAFDYVRVGIAVYGMLSEFEDTKNYDTGLRPVLSVKARISAVKTLYAGESVGYGLAFTAPHDMKIAILAIGYADGFPRLLSCGNGNVLINGQKAPIISRICMDQTIVDITGIDNVNQGDTAVVIGKSGESEITACEIAEQSGTIANEILSRLAGRLAKHTCNVDK